ncbi:hypothetical protein GKE82_10385 [Conexibacter sp. W3-3-2]|uniref:Uncharacterized protein n=1 Tax=Paraconexibacter algicola TaxID=2133960 RepID=A0A2T4UGQ0_9ACTN|nr:MULTISPECIES: hypothetical protein [Solirubrobacterales]MTD44685.1 hypothetical protein [Conexibacter sp. W3-3-2]PTL58426.1 hypothetical protein C7Y72_01545 [Paraconexibacter algicola]
MDTDPITPTEREHEQEAAAEAAAIGGTGTSEADPAQQAVREAGGGEAEGFEDAERALVDNASHGDQHAAHRVLQDMPDPEPEREAAEHGEADREEDAG